MTTREFEIAFRKLYLPLSMYALRIVDDADVSEDLVQNAFMKAWLYIGSGNDVGNCTSFMYRTLRNECLKYLRDRRETLGENYIPKQTTLSEAV